MVRPHRISYADMSGDTLVKASFCKYSICRREMLFPIQPFILQALECGILSYLERFTRAGAAHGCDGLVIGGFGMVNAERRDGSLVRL